MRTTRIDCQITCVEPEVDARFLVEEVEAGRLWAVGFSKYQAYLEKNLHGEIASAATLYLGGRESDKRYRGYEKGAESGWPVPATRHELQARGDVADGIFRRLTDRGKLEDGKGPLLMTAEDATVRDALGTMVDFRDTSRWEGRRKPNRWAQSAPVPEWWERVLQHRPLPIEVEYRPPGDLRAAWRAMVDQYGRKVALEVTRASLARGEDALDVLEELYLECASRCKRDDWRVLVPLLPGLQEEDIRDAFEHLTADAAVFQEGLVYEEGQIPPC